MPSFLGLDILSESRRGFVGFLASCSKRFLRQSLACDCAVSAALRPNPTGDVSFSHETAVLKGSTVGFSLPLFFYFHFSSEAVARPAGLCLHQPSRDAYMFKIVFSAVLTYGKRVRPDSGEPVEQTCRTRHADGMSG